MHRSSSHNRFSDQFVVNSSPSSQSQSARQSTDSDHQEQQHQQQRILLQHERLPTFDPFSHAGKRESSRLRSAENVIHLIPLVLVLCAVILWVFSTTDTVAKRR